MHIKLTNPTDAFDRLEALEFRYLSTPAQTSKNTFYIKTVKYRLDDDGVFAYSDEPPEEVFIKDVDIYLADQPAIPTQAFGACIYMVSHLLSEFKNIESEVVV